MSDSSAERTNYFRAGLTTGVAFVLLTAAAGLGLTEWLEEPVTAVLQTRPARWMDVTGSIYGMVGSVEVTGPSVFLLAAVIWRRDRRLAVALVVAFVLAQGLGIALKRWLIHEGPPVELARPGWFPVRVASSAIRPGNSYPSGHALRLMFILVMLAAAGLPRKFLLLLWPVAVGLVVLWTYFGAHWSTDIFGGALLGVSAAALAVGLTPSCDPFLRKSRTHRLGMEGQGGDSAITGCPMPGAIPGPCSDQGTPSPPR